MSQVDESSLSSPSPQMRRDGDSDTHAEDAGAAQVAQNQLQRQTPAVGVEEAVDHVAPSPQQQDNSDRGHSRGRTQVSDARMMSNLARFSSIRGPVARSSSLERTSRLRTSMFPPDMDVDTRGANEEIGMAAGIIDSIHNREFNEGDYELLLALDRGINHGGASGSQINGLPESTVESIQEEACAICLETPNCRRHNPPPPLLPQISQGLYRSVAGEDNILSSMQAIHNVNMFCRLQNLFARTAPDNSFLS